MLSSNNSYDHNSYYNDFKQHIVEIFEQKSISYTTKNSNIASKPIDRKCTVNNFKFFSNQSWIQPKFSALYDTGCSINAGLVISKQCANLFNFTIQSRPSDPNLTYTCKLADGSSLAIFGFVHQVQILVNDKILRFFDVPVFERLGYQAIFGFASFFEKKLSICPDKSGVKLVILDHISPLGVKEVGVKPPMVAVDSMEGGERENSDNPPLRPVFKPFKCATGPTQISPSLHCPGYPNSHSTAPPSPQLNNELESAHGQDYEFEYCEVTSVEGAQPPLPSERGAAYIVDTFEIETLPQGTVFNLESTDGVDSPPSQGAGGSPPPSDVKLRHVSSIVESTSILPEKESKSKSIIDPSCNDFKPSFEPKILNKSIPLAISKGNIPVGRRNRVNVRRKATRVALHGLKLGGEGMLKIPHLKLKPWSVNNISLPINMLKGEIPVGSSPCLYISEDTWLVDGTLLVPEGTYPRKLLQARVSIANVSPEEVDFPGGSLHGELAVSSRIPDIWIPLQQHLKLVKYQKKSRVEKKTAAREGLNKLTKLSQMPQWLRSDWTNNVHVVDSDNLHDRINNSVASDKNNDNMSQNIKDPAVGQSPSDVNSFEVKPNNLCEPKIDISPNIGRAQQVKEVLKVLEIHNNPLLKSMGLISRAENLIDRKLETFALVGGAQVGNSGKEEVELKLKMGATPPNAKSRPLNPLMLENLKAQIKDWVKDGVIRASTSEFASPLVPVKKKDGQIRWAVDYRTLNEVLEGDSFPLPNIDSLLDNVAGKKYFSSLDTSQAFLSIKLSENSKQITAFICPEGAFEFCRLPFGLKVSPSLYSRFIQNALRKVAGSDLAVYLDDVLLASNDVNEHFERLEQLFEAHIEAGLLLKPSKTKLFKEEIEFLGHIISNRGIETSPTHVAAIVNWKPPNTGKELSSFLGLATYYSKFIPNFSKLSAPLHTLKKEEVINEWPQKCLQNFEQLKSEFSGPLIRAAPRWQELRDNPFIVTVDWSAQAMGFTLSQMQEGEERLICAGGRKCTSGESNYPSFKGEMCALVSAVKRFDPYLALNKFVVRTDATALKWLVTMRCGEAIIARWHQVLAGYDFEVVHVPGRANVVADALSRTPTLYDTTSDQPDMEREEADFAGVQECPAELHSTYTPILFKLAASKCTVKAKNAFFPLPSTIEATHPIGRGWPAKPLSADLTDASGGGAAAPPPTFTANVDLQPVLPLPTPVPPGRSPTSVSAVKSTLVDNSCRRGGAAPGAPQSIRSSRSLAALVPGQGLQELFTENDELLEMLNQLKEWQLADPVLKIVHHWVSNNIVPDRNEQMGSCLMTYARILDQLHLDVEGRLWRKSEDCFLNLHNQFLMPLAMFEPMWRVCHQARAAPHPGKDRTLQQFKKYVYSPDLSDLVEVRSRKCNDCMLRISHTDLRQGPHSRDVAGLPNGCWSIDTVGPITADGDNIYILSCQDLFSRFLMLEPMPNKKANTVVRSLFKIIKMVGLPARIRTDMGLEFKNQLLAQICKEHGIAVTNSVPYFHNSNMVERAHKELNQGLKMLLPSPPDGWVDALAPLLLAYNSQEHRVTGFSPNRLFFGRESFHPLQLNLQVNMPLPATAAEHLFTLKKQADVIANRLHEANKRYLRQKANVYRDHPDTPFQVGDSIFFVNKYFRPQGVSERLVYRWAGPATIEKIEGSYLTVKCLDDRLQEQVLKLHISVCRKRVKADKPLTPSPETMEPEEYTTLLLPPYPQHANNTWPVARDPVVDGGGPEPDNSGVGGHGPEDNQGPAVDHPAPNGNGGQGPGGNQGPAAPPDRGARDPGVVTRAGRVIRPPPRHADYTRLAQMGRASRKPGCTIALVGT